MYKNSIYKELARILNVFSDGSGRTLHKVLKWCRAVGEMSKVEFGFSFLPRPSQSSELVSAEFCLGR